MSVLIRERKPPLESTESVATFDPGATALHEWEQTYLPLYVTTPTTSGRIRTRFDTRTLPNAVGHVEQLLSERDFEGFWLRYHASLVNCLHELRVNALEARFADIAGNTDTTFITWSDATAKANEEVYDEIYGEVVES